jgi:hypothetical protein
VAPVSSASAGLSDATTWIGNVFPPSSDFATTSCSAEVVVGEVDDAAVGGVRREPLPVLLYRVLVELVVEAAVAVRGGRRRRP